MHKHCCAKISSHHFFNTFCVNMSATNLYYIFIKDQKYMANKQLAEIWSASAAEELHALSKPFSAVHEKAIDSFISVSGIHETKRLKHLSQSTHTVCSMELQSARQGLLRTYVQSMRPRSWVCLPSCSPHPSVTAIQKQEGVTNRGTRERTEAPSCIRGSVK